MHVAPAPLQVTAAGVALHFDGSNGAPPPQATAEFKKPKGPEDIARMPRVFHASFLLLPQGTAGPDAEVRVSGKGGGWSAGETRGLARSTNLSLLRHD